MNETLPYHIIYNPYANRGGAKRYLDRFTTLLDSKAVPYVLHQTAKTGHATQITRDIIAAGAKYIVIMGGDGTVHEVVNGYTPGDDVAFGIIPAGTGNDVANMLNIPPALDDVEAAAQPILNKDIRTVDYIASSQNLQSLLFFSYGIAAQMILEMRGFKTKNKMSYYKSLIKRMFTFKASVYEVNYDGKTRTIKADFCGVHNCIHAGGGMTLINSAIIDDGYLELFMVENRGLGRRVLNFISILRKKVHKQPNVQIIRVKNVTISSPNDSLCCIDGEIYELNRLDISIMPKGINMMR